MIRHLVSLLSCATVFFGSSSAVFAGADNNSNDIETVEWDLGVGLGVFAYHLYPGSKEKDQLLLPVPYFTYRSSLFEIDRGIKSFLYNSQLMIVDISADFLLPVDSDDTAVREAMPDLDFMLQFGPSLEFKLNDATRNYFHARFELPLRFAIATDFSDIESAGYLLEPRLSFDHQRSSLSGLSHKVTLGLKFATREFHAYYYDVSAEFATATRPEFVSSAGFGGSFVNYRMTYRSGDFVYWMLLRYQSLRAAEFSDSPLVEQQDYYLFGAGFSWILAGSH